MLQSKFRLPDWRRRATRLSRTCSCGGKVSHVLHACMVMFIHICAVINACVFVCERYANADIHTHIDTLMHSHSLHPLQLEPSVSYHTSGALQDAVIELIAKDQCRASSAHKNKHSTEQARTSPVRCQSHELIHGMGHGHACIRNIEFA